MIVKYKIPFNKPFIVGKELYYIARAVQSGHLAGDGEFTKLCQKWLEEKFSIKKALLTHSCTAALEMAALLCDIKPGDEVIMPSFTFVSTANAFVLRGAKIRFVEIRPDTLNINEELIESAITNKTKVIVPVHYAGVGCEMDEIMDIADRYGLFVVEDAAQGVNATYKGRYLGSIGHLAGFSFHETKNFICGEGGALMINDTSFIERAEIIREKGTERAKFFRGEIDKYTWMDIGSSYSPSEIVAAFLYAQLEEAEYITNRRWEIFKKYQVSFEPYQTQGKIRISISPPECVHNAHMFYILLPNRQLRDGFIEHLKKNGILAVFHYIPLHLSPMGKKWSSCDVNLPITENISERLVRLPCYFELTESEQDQVIEKSIEFFNEF